MIYLNEETLNKLTTARLLALYKSTRKSVDVKGNHHRDDHLKMVEYKEKIKTLLDTREHVAL